MGLAWTLHYDNEVCRAPPERREHNASLSGGTVCHTRAVGELRFLIQMSGVLCNTVVTAWETMFCSCSNMVTQFEILVELRPLCVFTTF